MPSTYTYPGVYVEEIPSGVHTITGVSTSDTAFVDFFNRGPTNQPVRITGFTDFERQFGGLDTRSRGHWFSAITLLADCFWVRLFRYLHTQTRTRRHRDMHIKIHYRNTYVRTHTFIQKKGCDW